MLILEILQIILSIVNQSRSIPKYINLAEGVRFELTEE